MQLNSNSIVWIMGRETEQNIEPQRISDIGVHTRTWAWVGVAGPNDDLKCGKLDHCTHSSSWQRGGSHRTWISWFVSDSGLSPNLQLASCLIRNALSAQVSCGALTIGVLV